MLFLLKTFLDIDAALENTFLMSRKRGNEVASSRWKDSLLEEGNCLLFLKYISAEGTEYHNNMDQEGEAKHNPFQIDCYIIHQENNAIRTKTSKISWWRATTILGD